MILQYGEISINGDKISAVESYPPTYNYYIENERKKQWLDPGKNLFFLREIGQVVLKSKYLSGKFGNTGYIKLEFAN